MDMNEYWGGVTNPSRHQQNNFRYLVHVTPDLNEFLDIAIKRNYPSDVLSASLIDQLHAKTYYEGACVILGVLAQDVLITSPKNYYSEALLYEELIAMSQEQPKLKPEKLLANTNFFEHNEVVINARFDVLGLAVHFNPQYPQIYRDVSRAAEEHGLPFVEIHRANIGKIPMRVLRQTIKGTTL